MPTNFFGEAETATVDAPGMKRGGIFPAIKILTTPGGIRNRAVENSFSHFTCSRIGLCIGARESRWIGGISPQRAIITRKLPRLGDNTWQSVGKIGPADAVDHRPAQVLERIG